jgi:hypothetical protein
LTNAADHGLTNEIKGQSPSRTQEYSTEAIPFELNRRRSFEHSALRRTPDMPTERARFEGLQFLKLSKHRAPVRHPLSVMNPLSDLKRYYLYAAKTRHYYSSLGSAPHRIHEEVGQNDGAILLEDGLGRRRDGPVGSLGDQLGLDARGIARVDLGLERSRDEDVTGELEDGVRVFHLEERGWHFEYGGLKTVSSSTNDKKLYNTKNGAANLSSSGF